MHHVAAIGIGGVNLSIWCDDRIELQRPDAGYESFVNPAASRSGTVSLRIVLDLHGSPSISGMAKIFDTGETWAMFARDNERLVIHKREVNSRPLWAAHISSGSPEVTVYCGDELITRRNGRTTVYNPVSYPLDLIMLMYVLAEHHGLVVHCAGASIDGKGLIFPGRSGAGKSTLTNCIASHPGVKVLGDDRIVVRKTDAGFTAFGTPWLGTAARCRNECVPLHGIVFIERGESNEIRRIPAAEAVKRLLPTVSVPWFDELFLPGVLSVCEELVAGTPCYELAFTPGEEVAETLTSVVKNAI